MGRKAEQNKISSGTNGVMVEHNAVYDDNLLPAADELAKLHAIDPDIVPWIKSRTEIEQEARIDFNKNRVRLAFREVNYSGYSTVLSIILCAGVIAGVMWLSYVLIMKGYDVAGTIFGSADLVALLMVVSKIRSRKNA